jgi:hypothetical protein
MPYSLEMQLIIMSLRLVDSTPSIRWYILDLSTMHSTLVLSSDGAWLSKNALNGLIQSYASCCTDSSITIRSGPIASLVDSSGLTEGLDNFSTMTSDGVGALEEVIHAKFKTISVLSWLLAMNLP